MLTLHLEAATMTDLLQAAADALHANIVVQRDAEPAPEVKTAEERMADLTPPASSEVKTTKRGRPRKETAPAGAPEVPAVQPAVTDNTGSAPAGQTSAAEDATMTGAAAKASAPVATTDVAADEATLSVVAAPSADAFRAKLQDMNAHGEHGYKHVCALLEEFGFKRVKDVPPESYAALMARADTWLGEQQKAA